MANFGGTAIGATIGGLFGIGQTAIQNERAMQMADRDRAENFRYGEMAANNAMKRQISLTERYMTPEAQIAHLRSAGLSPSLMYGAGGGTQGVSAPQGGGAGNIQTPVKGVDMTALTAMAQVANLEAQTRKTNAETEEINGENEKGRATISKIWAEAGATEASRKLTEAQTRGQNATNIVLEATTNDQIEIACNKAQQSGWELADAMYEAKKKKLSFEFDQKTFQTNLDIRKQELVNLIKEANKKDSEISLNEKELEEITNRIELAWKDYDLKAWQTQLNEANTEAEIIRIYNQIGIDWKGLDLKNKQIWTEFAEKVFRDLVFGVSMFYGKFTMPTNGSTLIPFTDVNAPIQVNPIRVPNGYENLFKF